MMARMLSRVACSTSPALGAGLPSAAAFLAVAFSVFTAISPQLPSRALTSSPASACGQSLRPQLGPSAFFCASAWLSSSLDKKLDQVAPTLEGSVLYRE